MEPDNFEDKYYFQGYAKIHEILKICILKNQLPYGMSCHHESWMHSAYKRFKLWIMSLPAGHGTEPGPWVYLIHMVTTMYTTEISIAGATCHILTYNHSS